MGCTGPDGRIDYPRTGLLGAGAGAAAFRAGGAIKGDQPRYPVYGYGEPVPSYRYGYGQPLYGRPQPYY